MLQIHLDDQAYKMETRYGDLTIASDEQYGFRPFQLMVASIAGCSGTVLRKILIKKRVDVEDITIKAEVKRNAAEADRIESIHLTFLIKANGLKEHQMERILDLTRKNCSMVRSVEGSIDITESYELME